jgi:predicted transcriptional regulator YdeE
MPKGEDFSKPLTHCCRKPILDLQKNQFNQIKMEKIEQFYIIGIAVRTTNQNGQAAQDIPTLWGRFMGENIASKIPNKVGESVYCLYTDYEEDYMKPYTTILGCQVSNLDTIPEGMTSKIIESGNYSKQTAKGNLMQGIVFNEWTKIWNSDLNRAYTTDFEVYDEKSQNPENAEVDIFVAVSND